MFETIAVSCALIATRGALATAVFLTPEMFNNSPRDLNA